MQESKNNMKKLSVTITVGLLAVIGCGLVQTNANAGQRPINDFLSRQGAWSLHLDANGNVNCTSSLYDGGVSGVVFDPPIHNFVDWTEPQNNTSAVFDYAGLVNAAAGGALGTTTSGSINEVVHPDGSVTVSILLHTTHALAWATTGASGYGTDLFGHTGLEVLAGASPSFGSCMLRLVINGPAAGQKLPDFFEVYYGCGTWSLVSVDFRLHAGQRAGAD